MSHVKDGFRHSMEQDHQDGNEKVQEDAEILHERIGHDDAGEKAGDEASPLPADMDFERSEQSQSECEHPLKHLGRVVGDGGKRTDGVTHGFDVASVQHGAGLLATGGVFHVHPGAFIQSGYVKVTANDDNTVGQRLMELKGRHAL